ncbi:MAG: helix-turn-helix transcriptional regulator [Microcystis sp. LE18-22.4A]|jgi:transcriptional regulator with XRE-family HTH domain|uniref:helix-turn-helix domain-containing protein n=1 Tax=Microcystis sp. LE18-22.4A TaxID=3016432 RepID=UPI0022C612FE|nr:helix-turn-helix transcriptional regulator [Microcystis sp. LE18-22.4A]MCZ8116508.1 helix-turn-helix transcriptional regulator [Microcystis sp. LE18-22.4A]
MAGKLVTAVAVTVRKLLKKRNLSQEALGYRANLDRTYISGVERGVRNITLDSLEQIISALDMDIVTFVNTVAEEINELYHK